MWVMGLLAKSYIEHMKKKGTYNALGHMEGSPTL